MSIFKCKMCGGTIEFEQGATVGVCDSCGTKQSLPVGLDDEKRANLYDRANHFRRNNMSALMYYYYEHADGERLDEMLDIINLDECKAIENCMICTICDGVVYQPLQCVKCENLFCRNCIEEWRKKSNSCPYKCQILS